MKLLTLAISWNRPRQTALACSIAVLKVVLSPANNNFQHLVHWISKSQHCGQETHFTELLETNEVSHLNVFFFFFLKACCQPVQCRNNVYISSVVILKVTYPVLLFSDTVQMCDRASSSANLRQATQLCRFCISVDYQQHELYWRCTAISYCGPSQQPYRVLLLGSKVNTRERFSPWRLS